MIQTRLFRRIQWIQLYLDPGELVVLVLGTGDPNDPNAPIQEDPMEDPNDPNYKIQRSKLLMDPNDPNARRCSGGSNGSK